jgi:hypothetical protein
MEDNTKPIFETYDRHGEAQRIPVPGGYLYRTWMTLLYVWDGAYREHGTWSAPVFVPDVPETTP